MPLRKVWAERSCLLFAFLGVRITPSAYFFAPVVENFNTCGRVGAGAVGPCELGTLFSHFDGYEKPQASCFLVFISSLLDALVKRSILTVGLTNLSSVVVMQPLSVSTCRSIPPRGV